MKIQKSRKTGRTKKLMSLAVALILMLSLVPMNVSARELPKPLKDWGFTTTEDFQESENLKFDRNANTYTETVYNGYLEVTQEINVNSVNEVIVISRGYSSSVLLTAISPVTIKGTGGVSNAILQQLPNGEETKYDGDFSSGTITKPGYYCFSWFTYIDHIIFIEVIDGGSATKTAPTTQAPRTSETTVPATSSGNSLSNPRGLKAGVFMGNVLNTDIMAYINENAIPSWTVDNKTVVVAEDLANYGFDVVWSDKEETLKITYNSAKKVNPIATTKNTKKAGWINTPYITTNIRTYIAGKEVQAYNIKGKTLVNIEDLGVATWDGVKREIKVTVK